MSTTFSMVNGDLYFSEATGKPEILSGVKKAAQDFVEELMTDYDPDTNRGTRIRNLDSVSLIRQEITETFDRLKERQSSNKAIDSKERLDKINRLIVESYDSLNVFFYVEIATVEMDIQGMLLLQQENKELVQVDQQLLQLSV